MILIFIAFSIKKKPISKFKKLILLMDKVEV